VRLAAQRERCRPVLCLVDQVLELDPVVEAVLVARVIGGRQRSATAPALAGDLLLLSSFKATP